MQIVLTNFVPSPSFEESFLRCFCLLVIFSEQQDREISRNHIKALTMELDIFLAQDVSTKINP